MNWDYFIYFALTAVLLWTAGAVLAWMDKRAWSITTTVAGLLVFFAFILGMWLSLERPPLRTMGETRLWYSFFMPVAGLIVYARYHYKWIFSFSAVMAMVFICINLFKPEIHSKTLMPALQSPWFAPHVIVYMFAYALLAAATLMAIWQLIGIKNKDRFAERKKTKMNGNPTDSNKSLLLIPSESEANGLLSSIDNLVYIGWAFLTTGMLFGALWAKEAWGHYWSWDPKETWAAVTWLAYLVYIHFRLARPTRHKIALWTLIVSFCLLQMCWWGINYLPSAQGSSVHTYSTR